MFYWLLLLGLSVVYIISDVVFISNASNKNESVYIGKKIYIAIVTLALVLFSGLRSINVGMDTGAYNILFQRVQSVNSLSNAKIASENVEIGYVALQYIVSRFGNFQVLLLIVGLISIIPISFIIYKYSKNIWMSYFIFISFGFYSFFMNGIRQALAMGCVLIGYYYAKKRKPGRYLLCILIGFTFHMSAIIFLPVYWLNKLKFNNKIIIYSIMLMVCTLLFKNQIFIFINRFSRQQYEFQEAGRGMMYWFMVLSVILGFLYKKSFIGRNEDNKMLLYMIIMTTIIWPVSSLNPTLFRLYYYYQIFLILYIPSLISIIKRPIKLFVASGYLLVSLYFLTEFVINSGLKYAPYFFFWQ